MSFWYFVLANQVEESVLETEWTGAINNAPIMIAGRFCPKGTAKIKDIEIVDHTWERETVDYDQLKLIKVTLLIDYQTWEKRYENVSHLFMAYPYQWEDSKSGKKDIKMKIDRNTQQPLYHKDAANVSPQRIFCTTYDPEPRNINVLEPGGINISASQDTNNQESQNENNPESQDTNNQESQVVYGSIDCEPIWVQDPANVIQFFGTREDCFRLNPDSEPTEVSEPMYLDENGFIIYPDPDTGKVDVSLSPQVKGYIGCPMDFSILQFPEA